MDAPVVGRDRLNENEQRALGGFFVEGSYTEEELKLVQVEVPVGSQRVATAFNENITVDCSITAVLSPRPHSRSPAGFPDEKKLARQFGSRVASYTAKIDVVIITTETVWVIEIKTRNQRIEGMHDAYEGFGQVLMNRDRLEEDYPTVAREREIKGLLLAEDSAVDVELFADSFVPRDVSFFDPLRGGFLLND